MSDFKQGDRVLYEKQLGGGLFRDVPGKILRKTPIGRYRVELHNGAHVTVAFYSLKRPVSIAGDST